MDQVVVRHAEIYDAEALHEIYSQPALYRDTLQLPHPTLKKWQTRTTDLPAGHYSLVACIEEKVAGQLSLMVDPSPRRNHVATFGMGVSEHYQGQGVASALMQEMVNLCDNWLRVERIELTVYTDNIAALALYRKFGFEVEGTGKRFAFRDGQYVDACYMARFRPA